MSFSLTIRRGPVRLAQRLPEFAKTSSTMRAMATPARSFHQAASKGKPASSFFTSRTTTASARGNASRKAGAGAGAGGARFYNQSTGTGTVPGGGNMVRKLLVNGAIFGGAFAALNIMFNTETREDGGMPKYEREYLNDTFLHTGLGLGIIGLSATQIVRSGLVYRLTMANPWLVGIGGVAAGIAAMIGTRSVSPDNYIPKYAFWTAFNASQAIFVAPLLAFVPAPLLARAGLYTVAMMGSIAIVGATAKQEKYLYLGAPLLAGATVVIASGFAPLLLPVTAVRTLAFTENLWLYGGLALFGGFTLYDVQKVLHHARLAEAGHIKRDPVNESMALELDFLNIFIRLVPILGGNRK